MLFTLNLFTFIQCLHGTNINLLIVINVIANFELGLYNALHEHEVSSPLNAKPQIDVLHISVDGGLSHGFSYLISL